MPLPLGAARRRWRLFVPCSSQRWLCRVPFGGVGVVPCSSKRRLRGLSTPPRQARVPCLRVPCAVLVLCACRRGSRFVVRSSCRRCVLRAFHGFPARGRGRRGRRSRPKPSAAVRCQTSLPRICRARFSARCLAATSLRSCARPSVCATSLRIAALRLIYGAFRRASPPYSMRGTVPRTIYRRSAAGFGARGLRLFSPTGENRSPLGGIVGTRPRTMTERGAARCGFASALGFDLLRYWGIGGNAPMPPIAPKPSPSRSASSC